MYLPDMRKYNLIAIIIFAVTVIISCRGTDEYSELPRPIAHFISLYWPNPEVSNFTQSDESTYEVYVKNGPTLKFNSDYEWISINGNGVSLPEVLLYDCLPDRLYSYLTSLSLLADCFSIERTPQIYTLTMLNFNVTYDITTGTIRQF